jgi:hypothetical protein
VLAAALFFIFTLGATTMSTPVTAQERYSAIRALQAIEEQRHARIIHRSADGREWWIDEGHPDTNVDWCICRAVEHGFLMHTVIWARNDLTMVQS